jgi:phage terminase large subunit-like protein
MQRVVVAVDPSGTNGEDDGDSVGIVVAGKGVDGKAYVLADRTCSFSPDRWGRQAVAAYHEFKADRVVAEKNFGGDMVRFVIQTADRRAAYKDVTASRGKVVRAEPIAALYEQGKVKHVGAFPEMEDQMCAFTGTGYVGEGSPDRVDALVWALTELMLGVSPPAAYSGTFTRR